MISHNYQLINARRLYTTRRRTLNSNVGTNFLIDIPAVIKRFSDKFRKNAWCYITSIF